MASTPAPGDDPPAAALEHRHERHVCTNGHDAPGICVHCKDRWPCDAARLLAAVEAVLEKAGEWSAESACLDGEAQKLASQGAGPLRLADMNARSVVLEMCAEQLREAITAALAGKEAGDA